MALLAQTLLRKISNRIQKIWNLPTCMAWLAGKGGTTSDSLGPPSGILAEI